MIGEVVANNNNRRINVTKKSLEKTESTEKKKSENDFDPRFEWMCQKKTGKLVLCKYDGSLCVCLCVFGSKKMCVTRRIRSGKMCSHWNNNEKKKSTHFV